MFSGTTEINVRKISHLVNRIQTEETEMSKHDEFEALNGLVMVDGDGDMMVISEHKVGLIHPIYITKNQAMDFFDLIERHSPTAIIKTPES